jgi:transposase
MYDLYPVSIVDFSTLRNTIKKINSQGIHKYTLIEDRGFFSTANIEEMDSADQSFIIPPASNLNSVKEAISAIHNAIHDPQYLKLYQKKPLFFMPADITVGEVKLKGHAHYDQKRKHLERNSFYERLYDLVEHLKNIHLKPWMNPGEVFRETAKRDAKFIEWKAVNGRFEVSIRKNAVSQVINKIGKFILLYRGDFSWEE